MARIQSHDRWADATLVRRSLFDTPVGTVRREIRFREHCDVNNEENYEPSRKFRAFSDTCLIRNNGDHRNFSNNS